MDILSSAVDKMASFFGLKEPKIKMSWDGDISLKIGSDIAVVVFIANYLIPNHPDLDFSVSLNRFTRRELSTETIIEKTGMVGYQIIAKKKDKEDEFVFCFLLMGKKDREGWLRENLGLEKPKEENQSKSCVLDFVPIAMSEMFIPEDKRLKSTPFKEGGFPFSTLSIVL